MRPGCCYYALKPTSKAPKIIIAPNVGLMVIAVRQWSAPYPHSSWRAGWEAYSGCLHSCLNSFESLLPNLHPYLLFAITIVGFVVQAVVCGHLAPGPHLMWAPWTRLFEAELEVGGATPWPWRRSCTHGARADCCTGGASWRRLGWHYRRDHGWGGPGHRRRERGVSRLHTERTHGPSWAQLCVNEPPSSSSSWGLRKTDGWGLRTTEASEQHDDDANHTHTSAAPTLSAGPQRWRGWTVCHDDHWPHLRQSSFLLGFLGTFAV